MNSFIGWIGGKKLLRKEIIARFPEEYGRYVEVFGGAGWVLFGLDPKPGRMEVYNDANGDLVNLFRCIKYHANAVQQELDWMLQSREAFLQCLNQRAETDIQRAARYFYQIKESFGCDTRTFATAPKPLINATAYLSKVRKRLQNVVIENLDFERLLKVYDRPDALFYLDPPYHGTEKYYSAQFSQADHERLKGALESVKGKWLLSYNDDDYIRELYKGYHIEPIGRRNQLSAKDKGGEYRELIIRNY